MMRLGRWTAIAFAAGALPAAASAQTWTNWTSSTGSSATGTLLGNTVTYSGGLNQLFTSSSATDYFAPTNPYTQGGLTAPDAGGNNGFIQIINPVTGTLHFGSAVTDLYLAFISVGAPSLGVTYTFDRAFSVVSNNNCPMLAYWGCGSYTTSGNTITGNEFSGTLKFSGTFTDLTLSTNPAENWHGFTVGAFALSTTTAPEPGSLTLMASGLVGMAGFLRRRKKTRS